MKAIFAMIIIFALCASAFAQGLTAGSGSSGQSEKFQSVGGDFGRSWISEFKAQNNETEKANQSDDKANDLWSWGNSPKGKKLVNGKLVDAPYYNWSLYNLSTNWLGDTSYLGNPIYMNSSSPGYYGYNTTSGTYVSAPLSPQYLSDDPWVLAQQLGRPVVSDNQVYYP
jgi:hypothetical protein